MQSFHIEPAEIAAVLEKNLTRYSLDVGIEETGRVLEAADGVARLDGLPGVMVEEMLQFADNTYGMAMNLNHGEVGAIVLGDYTRIEQGDVVRRTGRVLQVPVGEALLGRVVDPLGRPVDGKGVITSTEYRLVETDAPGIVDRTPVRRPLHTGLKIVDALTAIGRGQRELIIGDRRTGKTTVALDAILHQRRGDVWCVYVAIGQKMSTVVQLVEVLREHGALENCTVVAATAADPAPLQYIAPFAACAMAEYYRDAGRDALIVYDDLSKHAVAYREISLVLRRPAGREAFPGDIFYLHSRLLERAGQLRKVAGGGSLTALPVVETQEGDYSAYIPTNLISITDGQIYLENELFHQGFRPAMNVGLSVSRVGGDAQVAAIKKRAARLRLDLARFREIESFARLSSEVDKVTARQLRRGERLVEILKQKQHVPMGHDKQACVLWAATEGHFDDVPVQDIARCEEEWLAFVDNTCGDVLREIRETGALSDQCIAGLATAMQTFKTLFATTGASGDGVASGDAATTGGKK